MFQGYLISADSRSSHRIVAIIWNLTALEDRERYMQSEVYFEVKMG